MNEHRTIYSLVYYARQHVLAKRVLAIVILSVCLSRPGTDSSPGEIESPGFHRMIAWNSVARR